MVLTLYLDPISSPSRAVLALLEFAKVPYERKFISFFDKETKSPAFLQINPLGKVPAIDDNGLILREHEAILRHLVRTREGTKAFLPDDIKVQALVDQYYPFHHFAVRPHVIHYFMGSASLLPEGTFDKEKAQKQVEETLKTFETVFLGDKKYLAGDQITIADFSAADEILQLYHATDIDFDKFPKLKAYVENYLNDPVILEINKPIIELAKKK